MRIYTRTPRIKIGNTTYRFGRNGVSRSTKIAKGIRIGTTASGKRYISGGRGIFRFYQDLDELGYDAKTGNLQNQNPFGNGKPLTVAEKKQRQQQIQQARNQRKNDLSLGLLFAHPFVFVDHLLRKNKSEVKQVTQKTTPQTTPVQQNNSNNNFLAYDAKVDIYKDVNGVLTKITSGKATLDKTTIIIIANVTKEILYKDILDVHTEKGFVYISSKGRSIPLILKVVNPDLFMMELCNRIVN